MLKSPTSHGALTKQLLSYRIAAAQAAGKTVLAELLEEQERLLILNPRKDCRIIASQEPA